HELNQPLTAILSSAQAAQRLISRDPPDTRRVADFLEAVVKSDRRAGAVIQRLRSLFRKDEPRYETLDTNEAVEESVRLLGSDLLHRQVTVFTELAADLPRVRGDRVQLQQVILNLIVNGCDAMESSPPRDRQLVVATRHRKSGVVEL